VARNFLKHDVLCRFVVYSSQSQGGYSVKGENWMEEVEEHTSAQRIKQQQLVLLP
jgi:hypothetical protein